MNDDSSRLSAATTATIDDVSHFFTATPETNDDVSRISADPSETNNHISFVSAAAPDTDDDVSRVSAATSETNGDVPRTPSRKSKVGSKVPASPGSANRKQLRCSLSEEEIQALRQLAVGAARLALQEEGTKGAECRKTRVQHLADRFKQCASQNRDIGALGEATAQQLLELAKHSAAVATTFAVTPTAKPQFSLHITEDQERLRKCLEDLRNQRALSSSLLENLKSLCWHSAAGAARKVEMSRHVKEPERERGVWKKEEIQRRVDEVLAEIALDKSQECDRFTAPEQPGWRGVNLGGWLLWETGPCNRTAMVRKLKDAPMDEWTLSAELRKKVGNDEAERLIRHHRQTHVTKKDFEDIAAQGLNAVRVPFGYWLVTGPRAGEPFVGPDLGALDNAFNWAEETGLKVLLSYHGHPGFQSDHQASGRCSEDWVPEKWEPAVALAVLMKVSLRYGKRPCLAGIGVVNEPSCQLPIDRLLQYYKDAYAVIRKAGVPDDVQVVMPVYQRSFKEFRGILTEEAGYRNVVFDVHCYHLFSAGWYRMSLASHLRWAAGKGKTHDVIDIAKCKEKVMITEWCLKIPTWDWSMLSTWEWDALTRAQRTAVMKSFAIRQLRTFAKHSQGWFFWSWGDGDSPEWDFRECVKRGWLPARHPKEASTGADESRCVEPQSKRSRKVPS
jgi:glucan 1,3-beta-glucosidase